MKLAIDKKGKTIKMFKMPKAKFHGGIVLTKDIEITLGVSMGNELQTGESLASFVDLVKRHSKIRKVKILLCDYLQRHYLSIEEALKLGKNWIEDNKAIIDECGVIVEIVRWQEILNSEKFIEMKKEIDKLYMKDEEFKIAVDQLSMKHQSISNSKNYIVEEAAVTCLLEGYFTYPNMDLNPASYIAAERLKAKFTYKKYIISAPSEKVKKTDSNLYESLLEPSLTTIELLNRFGIHGEKKRIRFFKQVSDLIEEIKNLPDDTSEKELTEDNAVASSCCNSKTKVKIL